MAAVFSMQGIGIFVSALVSLITLLCFKSKIKEDPLNLDYVWRICLVNSMRFLESGKITQIVTANTM